MNMNFDPNKLKIPVFNLSNLSNLWKCKCIYYL